MLLHVHELHRIKFRQIQTHNRQIGVKERNNIKSCDLLSDISRRRVYRYGSQADYEGRIHADGDEAGFVVVIWYFPGFESVEAAEQDQDDVVGSGDGESNP